MTNVSTAARTVRTELRSAAELFHQLNQVREPCLTAARRTRDSHGIFGGLTATERRALRRETTR